MLRAAAGQGLLQLGLSRLGSHLPCCNGGNFSLIAPHDSFTAKAPGGHRPELGAQPGRGFVPTLEGCCLGAPQRSGAIQFFNAASRRARSRQPGPSRVLPASCEEFEALGGAAGSAAQPGLAQHQGTSPSPVGIEQLTASAETLPLVPPGWNWEHSTARLTQQRERLRPT